MGWLNSPVRLLVTSDLHFDHGRSRVTAESITAEINALSFDVLLLVGDIATSNGSTLEDSLRLFTHSGPKLLTLGNHELWAKLDAAVPSAVLDTRMLYLHTLPARVAATGFHLLDESPFVFDKRFGFVGSVGWYDYSYAPQDLQIPRRFYEAKVTPGSASYYSSYRHLLTPPDGKDDVPPESLEIFARWNDSRYVDWQMTDDEVCTFLLRRLEAHLNAVTHLPTLIAAVHHLPLPELLPPRTHPRATHAWDFAKAYLGSPRFGELLSRYPHLAYVFSGHSHFPAAARPPHSQTRYIATGSGYREKYYHLIDIP